MRNADDRLAYLDPDSATPSEEIPSIGACYTLAARRACWRNVCRNVATSSR